MLSHLAACVTYVVPVSTTGWTSPTKTQEYHPRQVERSLLKERRVHIAFSSLSGVLPGFTPAAGRKTCADSRSLQKYLETEKKKSILFTILTSCRPVPKQEFQLKYQRISLLYLPSLQEPIEGIMYN